jgi:hypothetical protein
MSKLEQKQNVVVVSPTAGFGNRLRAMCAAAIIAKNHKMKLTHCWDGGAYDCGNAYNIPKTQLYHDRGFEFFFKRDYIPRYDPEMHEKPTICFTEWNDPTKAWTQYKNYGRTKINPDQSYHEDEMLKFCMETPPKKSFMIETSNPISKASDIELSQTYQALFKPQDYFRDLVPTLPLNTIAIHVRRGDFLWYFGNTYVNDNILVRFIKTFNDPIIIFSDDAPLKALLANAVINKPNITIPTEGKTDEEIAFLEFLTMASCSKIIGTQGSSFSKEASLFGAKPYYSLNEMIKPFMS